MSANICAVRFCTILVMAFGLAGITPAIASKPVPKTIVGCVHNGNFKSSDGYDIHPRNANGEAIDLRPFEGHKVTITGDLLPGDAFIVKKPTRDSGRCVVPGPAGK